ncbi:MAG TPA: UDP-N-acetylmuramate--L-alanine ligase [Rhabdochlamydiaceae bacterium]|jgi:UDP-N-acetylmuramate--alanine ligase
MNIGNEDPLTYHFIGIGGIGMSALARILLQKGCRVSGSDVASSYVTEGLKQLGATIYQGHAEQNIVPSAAIVYSSDIPEDNVEMRAGKKLGCLFLHRSDLLCDLMRGDAALLVTGTHGKTTTSALLAHVLIEANLHPSFAVGGIIKGIESNGGYGRGSYFVAEGDESDGSFLKYHPFGAILTNIDDDHLNYWKTKDALIEGFKRFAQRVSSPEHFFWCGDDDELRALGTQGINYGFGEGNAMRILNFRQNGWKTLFELAFDGKKYADVEIPLVGGHNVLNATAVWGMSLRINIPEEKIRSAFASFKGISRRADFKGECKSISAYDDYAHHPTEIFATLRAIKHAIPHRRLIVAFQPHRFTRTRDCFTEFGAAFASADLLILTDIFSAGEKPIEGVTTHGLLQKIQQNCKTEVRYSPRANLPLFLLSILQKNDVLVTMGAGDITKVGPEVLAQLKE